MERESMPVDVCFVGAGPANLAGAYTLAKTLSDAGRDDVEIVVLEKGREIGAAKAPPSAKKVGSATGLAALLALFLAELLKRLLE